MYIYVIVRLCSQGCEVANFAGPLSHTFPMPQAARGQLWEHLLGGGRQHWCSKWSSPPVCAERLIQQPAGEPSKSLLICFPEDRPPSSAFWLSSCSGAALALSCTVCLRGPCFLRAQLTWLLLVLFVMFVLTSKKSQIKPRVSSVCVFSLEFG